MDQNLRRLMGRIAAELNLPPGLAEAIMNREGGFLDEDFDSFPGIPLPFGMPTTGDRITVVIGIDRSTGEATIMGRKTGSIISKIPVEQFSDGEIRETVTRQRETENEIKEAEKERGKLLSRIPDDESFCAFELCNIRDAIRNGFPFIINADQIKIVEEDTLLRLWMDGEISGASVNSEFGKDIINRQKKLAEAEATLIANKERLAKLNHLIERKSNFLPILKERISYLVENALKDDETFITVSSENDQPVIVVQAQIDETFNELPDDLKKMIILDILSGENEFPEEIQKALGIAGTVKAAQAILEPEKQISGKDKKQIPDKKEEKKK